MGKLIDVDDIEWQEGMFVTPNTKEPLPIIHKIATIEMLRDWQEEVKAISLDKIRQAIEEIKVEAGVEHIDGADCDDILVVELRDVLEILDKLIAESEVEG